ncbi:hypothetical protein EV175_003103 [Coemansia sp. RSA 1933]|nr:hypothetical protein EV175_003103 [Coemansia sp. RSA 1933]
MLVIKEKNGLTFSLHKVCTKALVNDVFAKYTELDDKRMEYNDFIASLFGNNNISKRVECVVNRELTLADFKDMSSPLYVTSLTVMLSISFADLLALVSRMPELKKMAALKVAFPANAQGTISVPKLKKELDKYSASLLPKLVTMRLEVSDSQHSKEEALDCLVDFMLKNAKALRRLEFG